MDFNATPDEARYRRSRYVGGCSLTLLAILAALMIGYGFLTRYLPLRTFDSAVWQEVRGEFSEVRVTMIESLVRGRRLDGLSRAQVLDLLGEPDGGLYFQEWDMVYWLGPQRGLFGIDSEWLVLRIGSDGRVSEYQVVED